MTKRLILLSIFAFSGSVLCAAPVTWYLSGAIMSDGGRVFGSFTYDGSTNTYSNVTVMTTPGPATTNGSAVLGGKNYGTNLVASLSASNQLTLVSSNPVIPNATGWLALPFVAPITDAGGAIELNTAVPAEGSCSSAACTTLTQEPRRSFVAGKVIAGAPSDPKTWYLNRVRFEDGGEAEGSFVFNGSTYTNVDVWVTSGIAFAAPLHYTAAKIGPGFPANSTVVSLVASNPAQPGERLLTLNLLGTMTAAGGTIGFSAAASSLEAVCTAVDCITLSQNTLRFVTSGQVTTVKPTGFTKIISDVVNGGGFQTFIQATNLTDLASSFVINFFQDNGAPFNVPGIGTSTIVQVPARGSAVLTSSGAGGLLQGWARVEAAADFNITAIFKLSNANSAGAVENAVFNEPVGMTSLTFPFDNNNGAISGLALTNSNPTIGVTILALGYDDTGTLLTNNTTIALPPNGHTAFNFQTQAGYANLAGKKGLVRLFAFPTQGLDAPPPFYGVNGLLLKFLPNFSNTTVQAIHQ